MTTAINMFLRATIRENGIPFDIKLDEQNETTIAAIEEGKRMLLDPSSPRYSSIDSLKAALEVWSSIVSARILNCFKNKYYPQS